MLLPFQGVLFPFALSQTLFQLSHSGIQSEDDDEIQAGYYTQRHHCLVGDAADDIGTLGKIHETDVTADGSLLEQGDKLITHRRQHILEGLWQDDESHGLAIRKTKTSTRFHLSLIYRHDTRTDDLGNICRRVQTEGYDGYQDLVDIG